MKGRGCQHESSILTRDSPAKFRFSGEHSRMSEFVSVAKVSDLVPGKSKAVEIGGQQVALFNVDGKFYALANRCPHRGGPLAEGFLHGGPKVECPWHGWMFNLETGVSDINPQICQPVYEVRVEGGDVQLKLKR
jgi:NAD(P)H-dependent nitrite reductase small subunit